VKGWRMPPNTVCVTRPSRWGNPFRVGRDGDAAHCVHLFRRMLEVGPLPMPPPDFRVQETTINIVRNRIETLRGKNLACFCRLDQPCHADVLLELANAGSVR